MKEYHQSRYRGQRMKEYHQSRYSGTLSLFSLFFILISPLGCFGAETPVSLRKSQEMIPRCSGMILQVLESFETKLPLAIQDGHFTLLIPRNIPHL